MTFRPPRCLVFRDGQLCDGSSFFFSSSSSSESTSHERGVGIDGVVTARGDAALLFLFFFFCSAAFTAEIAAATAEEDFFATIDLVLHRDFMAPAAGSAPASALVSLSASTDELDS
jgi:hypothetical protein